MQAKNPKVKPAPVSTSVLEVIGSEASAFRSSIAVVLSAKPVQLLFAASAFRFCAGFGLGVWKPAFYLGK